MALVQLIHVKWQIDQLILFDCQPWQWRQRRQVKLYHDYHDHQLTSILS